jgi:hypothetical protein
MDQQTSVEHLEKKLDELEMNQQRTTESLRERMDAMETEVARLYSLSGHHQPTDPAVREKHSDIENARPSYPGDCVIL